MNKRQLIDAIRQFNAGVEICFLEQFSDADLQQYLARLEAAHRKHSLIAGVADTSKPKRPAMRIAV